MKFWPKWGDDDGEGANEVDDDEDESSDLAAATLVSFLMAITRTDVVGADARGPLLQPAVPRAPGSPRDPGDISPMDTISLLFYFILPKIRKINIHKKTTTNKVKTPDDECGQFKSTKIGHF